MSADNLKLTSAMLDQPILPISAADVRSAAITVVENVAFDACGSHLGAPDGALVGESATASLNEAQISEVLAMLGITEETLREGMFNVGQAVA